jgi:3-oxoacyl-[acyl-carrier-protein] synthase II
MENFGAAVNAFNDCPESASRPFDKSSAGPVLSDGGAVLCLEDLDHALKRKAKIYCELSGYG